jgi:hypothetical protein
MTLSEKSKEEIVTAGEAGLPLARSDSVMLIIPLNTVLNFKAEH